MSPQSNSFLMAGWPKQSWVHPVDGCSRMSYACGRLVWQQTASMDQVKNGTDDALQKLEEMVDTCEKDVAPFARGCALGSPSQSRVCQHPPDHETQFLAWARECFWLCMYQER